MNMILPATTNPHPGDDLQIFSKPAVAISYLCYHHGTTPITPQLFYFARRHEGLCCFCRPRGGSWDYGRLSPLGHPDQRLLRALPGKSGAAVREILLDFRVCFLRVPRCTGAGRFLCCIVP